MSTVATIGFAAVAFSAWLVLAWWILRASESLVGAIEGAEEAVDRDGEDGS